VKATKDTPLLGWEK